MADIILGEFKGYPELKKRLLGIGKMTVGKGGRTALLKAAQVVRNAAIQNVSVLDDPTTAENIASNIAVQFNGKYSKRTGNLMQRVGVRGGAKQTGDDGGSGGGKGNKGGDTWYWRFLEFGTEHQAPTPFMLPALTENIPKAIDTFISEYDKKLNKLIKSGKV